MGTCDTGSSFLAMATDPLLWAIALMGAWGALTLYVLLTMIRDRRGNPVPIIDHDAPPHTHGTERYPDGVPYRATRTRT